MKNFKYLLTACLVGVGFTGVAAHAEGDMGEGKGKAAAHRPHHHADFIHFCYYEGSNYSDGALIKAADTVLYCHAGKGRKMTKHSDSAEPARLAKWMTQDEAKAAETQEAEAKLPVPEEDKKAAKESKKESKEHSKKESDSSDSK